MQKLQQFYIMKFESGRLEKEKYNIKINVRQAKKNGELVALGDNQVLRSIRKLKNKKVDFDYINELFKERRRLVRRRDSIENKERIVQIDKDIDNLLFIPEYISVRIEKNTHYKAIIKKGLYINNKKYIRLLCGAGNARKNTVFFVQEEIYNELDKILCNGMNDIKIVPAKYNAYYGLSNSSTYKISEPRVCVIPDLEYDMVKKVDWITESIPKDIIEEKDKTLPFNAFDGMGIISPRMCAKWSEDLDLDYVPCCFIIRNYFVKGLVAEFDFHKFAKEIAKKDTIKDIYGVEYNIEDIDVILTKSQFKLARCV